LLSERVVIQAFYRGGEYRFNISRERCVYFNIRGEMSVIQASLRRGGVIYSNIYH